MSAMVTEEYEGAVCTNGFRILQPKRGTNPYYLLHYLRTPYFLQQVYRYRTGAAIPAISDEDLGRVLVYIAPAEEQRRIAQKVEESFSLRKKSRDMLKGIEPCIPKPESPSTQ
jgi:restriction endonuclease S subunit